MATREHADDASKAGHEVTAGQEAGNAEEAALEVSLRSPAKEVFGNALVCRHLLLACVPDAAAWSALARTCRACWAENTPALRRSARDRATPAGRAVMAVTAVLGPLMRPELALPMAVLRKLPSGAPHKTFMEAYTAVFEMCTARPTTGNPPEQDPVPARADLGRFFDAAALQLAPGSAELEGLAHLAGYYLRHMYKRGVEEWKLFPPGIVRMAEARETARARRAAGN
ncbi:hypothetical protein DFJ74DRAFT_678029 [Hyaloraphidium curvatum]|nr:hypothetical protein DFJ74DRAFT_678029 [Hyaloraphidium curvatum]